MMEVFEEITPKSYPINLLQKDWSKRKCFFFKPGKAFMAKVHEMEVKDDDVWIVTLPKCGTTWMQELLWLVMNDFDFEGAKNEHLEVRSPFLEAHYYLNADLNCALDPVNALKSPRLIKSHLPLPLLPKQLWEKKPKLIYVYRNPADALVSKYYHRRSLGLCMNITLENYIINYIKEGSYNELPFNHLTEFYALRNEPWIYYTSFHRMKSDLPGVILDICKFLNKSINGVQLEKMLKHLSFEKIKKNHLCEIEQIHREGNLSYDPNNLIHRGNMNGYRGEELPAEIIALMEKWLEDNLPARIVALEELFLLDF